jgi:type IV pilus assembly protein PilX
MEQTMKHDFSHSKHKSHTPSQQQGIVLISAVVILVIITLLSLSMFRGFGLQERIAGNTREKQRAFNAAETALEYAEWWLQQGNSLTAQCTSLLDANAATPTTQICSNPMTSSQLTTVPWVTSTTNIGVTYLPPGMTVSTTGGTDTYTITPRFYITPLGVDPNDPSKSAALYQITAAANGGNKNATAIVQSTYSVSSPVTCLSDC